MSNRLLSCVWKMKLPATEKVVLAALADCANEAGAAWPAIRSQSGKLDLLTMTSLSERAIQNAIKALCAAGHLSRLETPGRMVTYTVHPRTTCTPAEDAPPQEVRPAGGAPTPAADAPEPPVTPIDQYEPALALAIDPEIAKALAADAVARAAETQKKRWKGMPPPAEVSDELWRSFIDYRRSRRQTLTDGAYKLLANRLEKFADAEWPPGRIIETIIERGWLTFERPWIDRITEQEKGNGNRTGNYKGNAGGKRFRDPLLQSDFEAGRISP